MLVRRNTQEELLSHSLSYEGDKASGSSRTRSGGLVEKLLAWLGQQGVVKAKLEGRENTRSVSMETSAAIRWTTGGSTTCWTRTSGPRSSPRASPSTCASARC